MLSLSCVQTSWFESVHCLLFCEIMYTFVSMCHIDTHILCDMYICHVHVCVCAHINTSLSITFRNHHTRTLSFDPLTYCLNLNLLYTHPTLSCLSFFTPVSITVMHKHQNRFLAVRGSLRFKGYIQYVFILPYYIIILLPPPPPNLA